MDEWWVDVGELADVVRRRKVLVHVDDTEVVVVAHQGALYALDNRCIHKQRELVRGVILRDRLVCPGHQWAFALETGCEASMGECQPIWTVRTSEAGRVEIDRNSRRTSPAPAPAPTDGTT